MMLAIGDRIIASGQTGTIIPAPAYVCEGYCVVRYDHLKSQESYVGSMVKLAEVKPLVIQLVQLPLPFVWERAS